MTVFNVTNLLDLNNAIAEVDAGGADGVAAAQTIDLAIPGGSLGYTLDLNAINLVAGESLKIIGNGTTLDGGDVAHGLFVLSGNVTVTDLTIQDAAAIGGAGGSGQIGGGGGAGLGGGLFLGANATVSLNDVAFSSDAAIGGVGGIGTTALNGVGGGGGLGGGAATGGGGGIGRQAIGGVSVPFGVSPGDTGIVPNAAGGGNGINDTEFDPPYTGPKPDSSGLLPSFQDLVALLAIAIGQAEFAFAAEIGGGIELAGSLANLTQQTVRDNNYVTFEGSSGGADGGGGGAGGAGPTHGEPGAGGGIGGGNATTNLGGAGGYGGGGGGTGYGFVGYGGDGGFGGGGGGSGGGVGGLYGGNFGGNGGFGGGGGGGAGTGQGGFGGGNGGFSGGGGGLGAGGDIFVQAGGRLTIGAGSLNGGQVAGGLANGGQSGGGATGGQGFGAGIFINGDNTVTLTPGAGQTLTVADPITDVAGSAPGQAGIGGLAVTGGGKAVLSAANTFTGGTTIGAATTLELTTTGGLRGGIAIAAGGVAQLDGGAGAVGGHITFLPGGGRLLLGAATPAGLPTAEIDGFAAGDVIDLTSMAPAGGFAGETNAAGLVTVATSVGTAALDLALNQQNGRPMLLVAPDGTGGAKLTMMPTGTTRFSVASAADLSEVLSFIDAGGADAVPFAGYTITLAGTAGGTIALSPDLAAVNLPTGASLTLIGNNETLDGGGTERGLLVYAGNVTLKNLTIADAVATGGAGGDGLVAGGGGGGLGGGLFVAAAATVTLSGVDFSDDSAVGGDGGTGGTAPAVGDPYGGGGGLGGMGGSGADGIPGGGGGVGADAYGAGGGMVEPAGRGILDGAAAGGTASNGDPGGAYGGGGNNGSDAAGGGGVAGGTNGDGGFGGGGSGAGFGNGGFGGGGGGFGPSNGGFGGGGGGGTPDALNHTGGFGAGSGATSGTGGGGLGAGGAVFVQQGGSLIISGGSIGGGSVAGGTGGTPGSAFGGGIFIQNSGTVAHFVTLAAASGQTLTIGNPIADEPGSVPGQGGAGGVMLQGGGEVVLGALNTFTGATSIGFGTTVLVSGRSGSGGTNIGTNATEEIGAGATADASGMTLATGALLQLDNGAIDGSGTLAFTTGAPARIVIGATALAGLPGNTIAGFAPGDTITLSNMGLSANFGTISASDVLKVVTNRGTASLQLTGVSTQAAIAATKDGSGIDITFAPSGVTNFTVASAADLNHALALIDVGGTDAAVNTAYTLTFTGSAGGTIALGSTELDAIDLASGSSLLIAGNGMVLDGGGTERGLLDYSGSIAVDNLTLQHMTAAGGAGGGGASGGGGGGGLGGGLFVAAGASAALSGVTFLDDSAVGGAGGSPNHSGFPYSSGGGGGMGGAGGTASATSNSGNGGGGGVGLAASGGSTGQNGSAGILLGAAGGGGGFHAIFNHASYTGGASGGGGGSGDAAGGGGVGGISGGMYSSTGNGGFGGGGGGGPGKGGFGGGGGGGGGLGSGGAGGFGGGAGGYGFPISQFTRNAAGFGGGMEGSSAGGGGLGAGGGLFVEQGGSVTFSGGGTTGGTASAGAAGTGGTTAAFPGSAFGGGIFIQSYSGTATLPFSVTTGQTLTIGDVIADELGSAGTGGKGQITANGGGTLLLRPQNGGANVANTFAGGATIGVGTTLELATGTAAGSGPIAFSSTASGRLVIDGATLPTGAIGGFGIGDTIDLTGLTATQSYAVYNNGSLSIATTTGTATLAVSTNFTNVPVLLSPDGVGGTTVTLPAPAATTSFIVTNESDLDEVLSFIDAGGAAAAANTAYSILLQLPDNTLQLSAALPLIDLDSGSALNIEGNGATIDGGGTRRGFFVQAGTLALRDLTVANMAATGGAGGNGRYGGGGGAGLGGGLFVYSGAAASLNNVAFSGNSAIGGAGGSDFPAGASDYQGGGGGGMGGAGSSTRVGPSGNYLGAGGPGVGPIGHGGNGGDSGIRGNDGQFGGGGGGYKGAGGFGGGAGGYGGGQFLGAAVPPPVGGGGGLGAGGAIFVMSGGVLSFGGGGINGGTVGGGVGGSGAASPGASGAALGAGIFVQTSKGTSQSIVLDPAPGQVLTVADPISDASSLGGGTANLILQQPGTAGAGEVVLSAANSFVGGTTINAGTLALTGAGSLAAAGALVVGGGGIFELDGASQTVGDFSGAGLVVLGAGTLTVTGSATDTFSGDIAGAGALVKQGADKLVLSGTNTQAGGIVVGDGTVELSTTAAAGDGVLSFLPNATGTFRIDGTAMPANAFDDFAGPQEVVDLANIASTATTAALGSDGRLVIPTVSGSVSLNFTDSADSAGEVFRLSPDGGGGTDIATTDFAVSSESQLNQLLSVLATNGLANTSYTISLVGVASGIMPLTSDLEAINLPSGASLTLLGDGVTMDGGGSARGLLVYRGKVTIDDLAIDNTVAHGGAGGAGGYGGGGGAGFGGGLFIATAAAVTLSGVSFLDTAAIGGAGGALAGGKNGGGGGGMGGAGGVGQASGFQGGGGGGVGAQAYGGSYGQNGGAGIIPGAASGGGATDIRAGHTNPAYQGGADGGGGGGGQYSGGGGVGGGTGRQFNFDGPIITNAGGGGFGGGGAGGESTGAYGANGGFGGGGGGRSNGGPYASGFGGFGGGNGAALGSPAAGNGGMGAGGDVFVEQGGSLTIEDGSLTGGSVAPGPGGAGGGTAGSAFGEGIFVQNSGTAAQTISLATLAGQTLTVADPITDQMAALGSGAGVGLDVGGQGLTALTAANSFSDGIVLSGGTLDLAVPGAASTGTIDFQPGLGATLRIDGASTPANVISGFALGDAIDLPAIPVGTTQPTLLANNELSIPDGTGSVTLDLDPNQDFTGAQFAVEADASGGSDIVLVASVSDEAGLNAAIQAIDVGGTSAATNGRYEIRLAPGTIALTAALTPIDLPAGAALAIQGDATTIDGGDTFAGFQVDAGSVVLSSVTVANAVARGADGVSGAGDAGMGGGLFVGAASNVVLSDVQLSGDSAVGGAGGAGFDGGDGVGGGAYVQAGGRLVVAAGTIGGDGVSGGVPGAGGTAGGASGSGIFGGGGVQSVVLAPPTSSTLTINDQISDLNGLNPSNPTSAGITSVIVAGGGTVVLDAANPYSGQTVVQQGTLELAMTGAAGSAAIFLDGGTLRIQPGVVVGNTIGGFPGGPLVPGGGDGLVFDLRGIAFSSFSDSLAPGNVLTVRDGLGDSVTLNLDPSLSLKAGDFTPSNDGGGFTLLTQMACFAAGTRIATPDGEVSVEALRAGGRVLTNAGETRAVKWIGYRRVDLTRHADPAVARPICIAAGAFADAVPRRDLLVSPDHALFVDGMLIPAKLLVNGGSIGPDADCRGVTYYHVELDSHDILLAEGLPAESYLDTGNRGVFENARQALRLHPDFAGAERSREALSCAPFVTDPAAIEPIWRALTARAAAIGLPPPPPPATVADPDPRLLANGRLIGPITVNEGRYRFVIPASCGPLRLISRTARPRDAWPWHSDVRQLGVLVRRMTHRRCQIVSDIAMDDPTLSVGWWPVEWHDGTPCRWTDGEADLPMVGPGLLEVELSGSMQYRTYDKDRLRAAA